MRAPGGYSDAGSGYQVRQDYDFDQSAPSIRKAPSRNNPEWAAHMPSTVLPFQRPAASTGGSSLAPGGVPGVGRRVRHGTYGLGIIRGVEGANQDAKVTVEFSGRLMKKFVLKFANLEVVG